MLSNAEFWLLSTMVSDSFLEAATGELETNSTIPGVTYHVDSLGLLGHHDGLGLVPGGRVHHHHLLAVLVLEWKYI